MAIRNIITIGEEILRKKARHVDQIDDRILQLVEDMKDTLKESGNGIGLAAPQVGMLKRVFIVDLQDEKGMTVYINPEIIATEGVQIGPEGCLSVPGKSGDVERPAKIKIRAQNERGEYFEEEAEDLRAVCICHENDHLNGILFPDRVKGGLSDV
ncbi:MAG: peptide deformylase [Fastidiosipilaceae bacterium]|jgi:peptide deformylase|nr:peptide deformylase [Clostridiaceae bacterium]